MKLFILLLIAGTISMSCSERKPSEAYKVFEMSNGEIVNLRIDMVYVKYLNKGDTLLFTDHLSDSKHLKYKVVSKYKGTFPDTKLNYITGVLLGS